MGPTREKKPSKRSIKVSQQMANLSTKPGDPKIPNDGSSLLHSTESLTESLVKPNLLSAPKPSAKSSRSSSKTDQSAGSTTSTPSVARPYDPSLIEVVSTPDRGYAVFTTIRVPAGTLILAEAPLIRLTAAEESSPSVSVQDILAHHFAALPKSSQKAYLKLHDSHKESFSRIKSIYFSNCYDLGKPDTGSVQGGSAIGLLASRINHSCVPNVQFSFSDTIPSHLVDLALQTPTEIGSGSHRGLMLFHTLRNLPAHRELLSNYDSIYMTREQRQMKQQMYYGFRCACEACTGKTDFWLRSDERRKEMSQLKAQIDWAQRRWEKTFGSKCGKGGEIMVANSCNKILQKTEANESICTPSEALTSEMKDDITINMLPALERLALLLVKEGIVGVDIDWVYRALKTWSLRANLDIEAQRWSKKASDASFIAFGKRNLENTDLGEE